MTQTNEVKTETNAILPLAEDAEDAVKVQDSAESVENHLVIDDILNSLKALLSTLEKLQKVR